MGCSDSGILPSKGISKKLFNYEVQKPKYLAGIAKHGF